jgi:arsenate reductase
MADARRARAISAGTEPAARVHPEVIEVMREVGLDRSRASINGETVEESCTAGCLQVLLAAPA